MKPPYQVTPVMLKLIAAISQKIGEVNAKYLVLQNPKLRKQNRIKTIHSSLLIEGNSLAEDQITAIVDNKRVVGPQKDILEVLNALDVYQSLKKLHFDREKDFLLAHQWLMKGLVSSPGKYRTKSVGIVKGKKVEHIAPPYHQVKFLMKDLFTYLKDRNELTLIKSCVFHYEMEFIHPFMDGNGRMGRLWQTLILMSEYPLFEFLPFETLIAKNQAQYYKVLALSDKAGSSTKFVEFMLKMIDQSLDDLLTHRIRKLNESERLQLFLESVTTEFTRKDYLDKFSQLSSATASRDLKWGVANKWIKKTGDKKTTRYTKKKSSF